MSDEWRAAGTRLQSSMKSDQQTDVFLEQSSFLFLVLERLYLNSKLYKQPVFWPGVYLDTNLQPPHPPFFKVDQENESDVFRSQNT